MCRHRPTTAFTRGLGKFSITTGITIIDPNPTSSFRDKSSFPEKALHFLEIKALE